MAVLVTANVDNQTEEGWDRIFTILGPAMRQAKGFIAVGGGRSRDGWRTFLETLRHLDKLEQPSTPQCELRGVAEYRAPFSVALEARQHHVDGPRIRCRSLLRMDTGVEHAWPHPTPC